MQTNINTILDWFKTEKNLRKLNSGKHGQSFWHKEEIISSQHTRTDKFRFRIIKNK